MSFKDIKGQDDAVGILKRLLQKDRIPQGILFYGPAGVGKYLTSLDFARAINCKKQKLDACGGCSSCVKIKNLNHPDVVIINHDAKQTSIKISDIRYMQEALSFKPYESEKKICVIRDADRMTAEAQNSLLKSLEDSSENTIIILIASNLENIFATVTSRCQLIRFRPLDGNIIKKILSKEKSGLSDKKIDYVVNLSGGSLERASSLLSEKVRKERDRLIDLLTGPKKELLFYTPEYKSRDDIIVFLDIMLSWYRDIFLIKSKAKDLITNKDKLDLLNENCDDIDLNNTFMVIDNILDTRKDIINNANVKLAIHNNMVKICELEGVI